MKNIIRIETLTIIDAIDLLSFDIVESEIYGIGSRGRLKEFHKEKYLVLFNKFRVLLKSTKPNK